MTDGQEHAPATATTERTEEEIRVLGENLPAPRAKEARNVQMGDLGLLPKDFYEMWQIAVTLARSDLVPKDYRDKPANVFVALEMGRELGLPMMFAVQNIAVINGRGTMWGDAVLAMVQASGLLAEMDEHFEGEWGTDTFKAVCMTVRSSQYNGQKPRTVTAEFSIADAKAAGLWGKTGQGGQPTPWVTYPKRMLQMRARGFNLRDNFADRLKGLLLHEEAEVIDVTPAPGDRPAASDPQAQALQERLEAARDKTHPLPPTGATPATAATPEAAKPEQKASGTARVLGEAIDRVNQLIERMNTEIASGAGLEALQQKAKQRNLQGLSVEQLGDIATFMEEQLRGAAAAKTAGCNCPDAPAGKHEEGCKLFTGKRRRGTQDPLI